MALELEPFDYRPPHQPDPDKPVTFKLKPLNLPSLHLMQAHYNRGKEPDWEALSTVFVRHVIGWTGTEPECTPQARQAVTVGNSLDWYQWIGYVCGELYTRAVMKEPERKNS